MKQLPSEDAELEALAELEQRLGSFATLLRSIADDVDGLWELATAYGDIRRTRRALGEPSTHTTGEQAKAVIVRVARHYRVTIGDITNGSKRKLLAEARQVSMYLIRIMFGQSYPTIAKSYWSLTGDYHKCYDHTTVVSAVKRVRYRMDNDSRFADVVDMLRRDIIASSGLESRPHRPN